MNKLYLLSKVVRNSMYICLILAISGCATVHEMRVNKKTANLKLDGKALVLMSMEVSNNYKPEYQPNILVAYVEKPDAKTKNDRHNFKTDLDGTIVSSKGTRYLLRMELSPGEYVIRGASCLYHSMFLMSSCMLPVHANINVAPNTITYVGRVSGVMRKREGGELRAGPVIPLIDQAVTGFAQSTFDVAVRDKSGEDLQSYRSIFPSLSKVKISTSILPPFDIKRAYAWWKSNGGSESTDEDTSKGEQAFAL
ncbi:MAG: hypothetical protein GY814_15405 [Gammaproteobacteria bacterium]|nr:hypothetical protein [Gammaproteobacteria bacterium]